MPTQPQCNGPYWQRLTWPHQDDPPKPEKANSSLQATSMKEELLHLLLPFQTGWSGTQIHSPSTNPPRPEQVLPGKSSPNLMWTCKNNSKTCTAYLSEPVGNCRNANLKNNRHSLLDAPTFWWCHGSNGLKQPTRVFRSVRNTAGKWWQELFRMVCKLKLQWEFAAFLKQCTSCEQKCSDSKQHQMMRVPTLASSSSVAGRAQSDDMNMFADDTCTRSGCRSSETGRFRGETCYGSTVSTAEFSSAPGHRIVQCSFLTFAGQLLNIMLLPAA